ncbi:MAG: hypothetical protein BGN91_02285 [Nitrobacter sp. 62-13]|nr:MAG: hypothetical protein BGN91_02285 [Nitrobacter sp. 62-13]
MHRATPGTPDQFMVTTEGMTRIPAGATFMPHFDNPDSGTVHKGQMGRSLKNGEEYQPERRSE